MSKNKQLIAGVLAMWLGCALQAATRGWEEPQSNWTSSDDPCAKYDDLRNRVLGNIGVKIDVPEPWADGFRRAIGFWNSVLAANFYEETSLSACAVRIINGGSDLLNHAVVARSQTTERLNFVGKIAVSSVAAKEMSSAEIYLVAVHELGHMLGLKHNESSHSVMYFLDIEPAVFLDSEDILDLNTHHKLRSGIVSTGFLPIQVSQGETR